MKINKTFIYNSLRFKRLKKRWTALPHNMILDVMEKSEVNEPLLNKVRSINLNNYIKEQRRNYDKKNTNG